MRSLDSNEVQNSTRLQSPPSQMAFRWLADSMFTLYSGIHVYAQRRFFNSHLTGKQCQSIVATLF